MQFKSKLYLVLAGRPTNNKSKIWKGLNKIDQVQQTQTKHPKDESIAQQILQREETTTHGDNDHVWCFMIIVILQVATPTSVFPEVA